MRKTLFVVLTLMASIATGLTSCADDDELEVWMATNPFDYNDVDSFGPFPPLPTDLTEEDRADLNSRINEMNAVFQSILPQYSSDFVGNDGETYCAGYTDLGLSVYWATQNLSPTGGRIGTEKLKKFTDFFNPDDYKDKIAWNGVLYYLKKEGGGTFDDIQFPLQMSYNDYLQMLQNINYDAALNAYKMAAYSYQTAEYEYNKALKDYRDAAFDYKNYVIEATFGYITEDETVLKWGTNKFYLWPQNTTPFYVVAGSNKYLDNNSALDAATNLLGEKWHTPTKQHFEELINKCSFEEISLYVKEGYHSIRGYKVTGPSGRSIFLPAGKGTMANVKYGEYWTSTKTGFYRTGWGDEIYTFKNKAISDMSTTYNELYLRPIRLK